MNRNKVRCKNFSGKQNRGAFYPFVQAGEETLVPFQEYVEENWLENAEKRMKEGHQRLISESIRMIHTEKGFYQRLRIIESKEVRHEREMGFI